MKALLLFCLALRAQNGSPPGPDPRQGLGGEYDALDEYDARKALASSGRSATGPLLAALASADPYHRARALQVLGETRDRRALPALRELLRTEKAPIVLCRAMQTLGRIGDPAALPSLLPFLDSPHRSVRAFAIWAVGESRSPSSLGLLLGILQTSRDPDILGFTLEAVSKVGTSAVEDRIVPFLPHPDARVRDAAAQTLGLLGDEKAVGDLFAQLDREETLQVQRALVRSIGRIGGPAAERQLGHMFAQTRAPLRQRMAADAFKEMGSRGLLCLKDLVDDPGQEPSVRALAARTLGDSGSGLANASLLKLLDAEDSLPRAAALYALARTGDSSTAEALRRASPDLKPWMRELAAEAVRRIREREVAAR